MLKAEYDAISPKDYFLKIERRKRRYAECDSAMEKRYDTFGLQSPEPQLVYQNTLSFSRRDSMEQNKREQFIIRRIGGTTYKVRVVFNENGGETMEDKILRIVRNDMVTNDGTCGIMEAPQMSRQSERSAS